MVHSSALPYLCEQAEQFIIEQMRKKQQVD